MLKTSLNKSLKLILKRLPYTPPLEKPYLSYPIISLKPIRMEAICFTVSSSIKLSDDHLFHRFVLINGKTKCSILIRLFFNLIHFTHYSVIYIPSHIQPFLSLPSVIGQFLVILCGGEEGTRRLSTSVLHFHTQYIGST